ncbi:hypothetical protein [Natronincola ferrireducens]|uniref:Uncharacterized protein n=1 Tax=Natronincola ferrireducens TaxID=393762 RepID=A0A1G9ITK3_9FIRM|nr:hypothetical protein [Natronincola ferrireducens]SDL28441.1 hypothetical protein SAMN05660472_02940 [Natronincola ferrireducens]
MQAIMEPIFHFSYLTTVIIIGFIMISKSKNNPYFKWFGIMAVTLGFGDAFHLIPRVISLMTTGFESHAAALGFGKFVTSITMTIFYLILYSLWKIRYDVKNVQKLDLIIWSLVVIRIALCFFPQNQWFLYESSITWAIYRNIPFAIMGLIMIVLFYKKGKEKNDNNALKISLAVVLSFGFYIPVVLWAHVHMLIGMLMIPKTLAYLWVVFIGFGEFRKELKESQ